MLTNKLESKISKRFQFFCDQNLAIANFLWLKLIIIESFGTEFYHSRNRNIVPNSPESRKLSQDNDSISSCIRIYRQMEIIIFSWL